MPVAPDPHVPIRVLLVTLDHHIAGAAERAGQRLRRDLPGLVFDVHAAADWGKDPAALAACKAGIARADIVIATMLFMDDHVTAILPDLLARRDHCDAMLGAMSAGEVMKLTRLGGFRMDGEAKGFIGLLKRLKGARKPGDATASSGARQMAMLRRLPKILRFIPGTAQDVRAYFLVLQYFLAGSEENTADMVRLLVDRYAAGPRAALRGAVKVAPPQEYLEVGLYHPRLPGGLTDDAARLPSPAQPRGAVGVLVMRSYVLAENTAHYDAVISALEARGLRVLPAFASGLDARPAVERFFKTADGRSAVDCVVSLTGFSLVGGPAYSEQGAAEAMLADLDVPCVSAQAVEFQTLEQWEAGAQGLSPVEATMMVAIPELDGSIAPIVFGGRSSRAGPSGRDMQPQLERVDTLAARVARLVALRRKTAAEKRVAITLFNFPPNAGDVGTAAYLDVFASLLNVLRGLAADGYATGELPATVDELRERIAGGNGARFGAPANIFARIPVDDHVLREPHLREIEAQWGPAPGKHGADGAGIQVWGERFGNVFVGVQPAFGYEGDPMRLLFEGGFAPTHHFSAYYRWLREDFGADAYLHFGMHGALEFMPGKQVGLSAACWPDRLIGEIPNVYLYAANNPSEGLLAKRRSGAVLVSHMTPPLAQAGLYKGLTELKGSLARWRAQTPDAAERDTLAPVLQAQAAALDLGAAEPAWTDADAQAARLVGALAELEATLIPHGMHVVGGARDAAVRASTLAAMAEAAGATLSPETALELAQGGEAQGADPERAGDLRRWAQLLGEDQETPGVLRALAGRYVRPAAAGDLVTTPDVLPTGRNLHGFDPYRLPSAAAAAEGARQAEKLLARHAADGHSLPESVALVLWGSDTMKTEGGPVAQALALMGARARFDGYGRLCGAELVPLAELARPRIDVVMTLSGIFRDLLPLQVRMLAEAARLAAEADEPVELNFIRKHALSRVAEEGCDLPTAALRVFSNADGAYGANVNHLVQSGAWEAEEELAECFARRKGHAYGCDGEPVAATALLKSLLAGVELTYQNLESVEMGVTTVDHYVDSLGGMTRAVKLARGGAAAPAYIGDSTRGDGRVRTMGEQVALETRTRQLNPQWFEAMLAHGHEGVRQIEHAVTNTLGLSATTGAVEPWVYQRLTETFVLDPAMRERLAALNPGGALRLANRLGEACDRAYWTPDPDTLAALRDAGDELEDRLEGVLPPPAAAARAPLEMRA